MTHEVQCKFHINFLKIMGLSLSAAATGLSFEKVFPQIDVGKDYIKQNSKAMDGFQLAAVLYHFIAYFSEFDHEKVDVLIKLLNDAHSDPENMENYKHQEQ